jgi:hypothetical protein
MAGKSKFWIVWSTFNMHLPISTYENEGEAISEAKRRSKLNPGQEFFVLKATHLMVSNDQGVKAQPV